jgi:predicted ABC-type ATPase
MDNLPKVVMIAGPNGAGKTTFAREFLPSDAGVLVFVNADLIAAGLSPFAPDVEAFRAGRMMLEEIDRHAASGRNFAFETTLSGHTYARRIDRWRSSGYIVELIFLSLASPEVAIARVAMRVRQGGHDVAHDVIRRRYASGMRNRLDVYRHRVDFWQWFDNSGPYPRLLDEGSKPMKDDLESMTDDLVSKLPNADMQAAPRALLRAARRAREIARMTNTAIVIVRDGKLVEEKITDTADAPPQRGA